MARRRRTSIQRVDEVDDVNGRTLSVGDTVSTVSGDLTGRVCGLATDAGAYFVLLRPVHQPYGLGEWHAADRVFWVASARNRGDKSASDNAPPKSPSPARAESDRPRPAPAKAAAPEPAKPADRRTQRTRGKGVSTSSSRRSPARPARPAARTRRKSN